MAATNVLYICIVYIITSHQGQTRGEGIAPNQGYTFFVRVFVVFLYTFTGATTTKNIQKFSSSCRLLCVCNAYLMVCYVSVYVLCVFYILFLSLILTLPLFYYIIYPGSPFYVYTTQPKYGTTTFILFLLADDDDDCRRGRENKSLIVYFIYGCTMPHVTLECVRLSKWWWYLLSFLSNADDNDNSTRESPNRTHFYDIFCFVFSSSWLLLYDTRVNVCRLYKKNISNI